MFCTPEKAAWLRARIELDIPPNSSYRLYRLGARHISRQEHVKVAEVRLTEAFVELENLSR